LPTETWLTGTDIYGFYIIRKDRMRRAGEDSAMLINNRLKYAKMT
jgi:hypothetical protein